MRRLQRYMIGLALQIRKSPGDDPAAYIRRPGRAASQAIAREQAWPEQHLRRVREWADRSEREREPSLAAHLLDCRVADWLQERREGIARSLVGRRTAGLGRVYLRWTDGAVMARDREVARWAAPGWVQTAEVCAE